MDFGDPTKLQYGKQVAAALSFIGLVNHDRVLLDTFSTTLNSGMPSVRGRSQMWRVVQYLEQLTANGSSNLTAAARSFAIKHAGKGVRGRDLRLPRQTWLRGCPPLFVGSEHGHLRHPCPQPRGGRAPSLSVTSGWSTVRTKTWPRFPWSAPLLKRYKDNLNAFVGGLKDWCTKRGITYIFTTNHNPFDKLILNYLRERGLVK